MGFVKDHLAYCTEKSLFLYFQQIPLNNEFKYLFELREIKCF